MQKGIFWFGFRTMLVWVVFVLGFVNSVPAQGEGIYPKWKLGDQWTVKTIYPSPTQENVWSPPLLWTYRVSAEDGIGLCCRY